MLSTYWQSSRAPRYSLLFALPLLLVYQTLAALAPAGPGGIGVRNGADHLMKEYLKELASQHENIHLVVCYSDPRPEERAGEAIGEDMRDNLRLGMWCTSVPG